MKKVLLFFACMSFAISINAGVMIEYLNYSLNHKEGTAIVLGGNKKCVEAGILVIPSTVQYDGSVYSVREIGDNAFSGWKEIVQLSLPVDLMVIGSGAFHGCSELWVVYCHELITKIGAWAFAGCVNLQAFDLSYFLTELGAHVFDGCKSLAAIGIPGTWLREILPAAFKGCESLSIINISPGIEKIGDRAFEGCAPSLLILPYTIKSFGWFAFKDCKNLSLITSRIMHPFVFEVNVFSDYDNVVLRVPKGTWERYKSVRYWNKFSNFEEVDFDEEETGIHTCISPEQNESEIYSINGTKTTKNHRGLKIIRKPNGKSIKYVK